MIRIDKAERGFGHSRVGGIFGILDNGKTAAFLYCFQPGGTIVELACENDPDYPSSLRCCRRAKENIDRGARSILSRCSRQNQFVSGDGKMMIGRCDVNFSGFEGIVIFAVFAGNLLKLLRISGRRDLESGRTCCTIKTEAARFGSSEVTRIFNASNPPLEQPTTIISRRNI